MNKNIIRAGKRRVLEERQREGGKEEVSGFVSEGINKGKEKGRTVWQSTSIRRELYEKNII